jgi:catechol 2,3-dioxygenase-like lactoylglutathione lyase family enzyme
MIDSSKIIAFVATRHPDRARSFYQDVLGLRLVGDDPFALVFDANGTMLRVQKVEALDPARYTALGWEVPDIAAAVDDLIGKGVEFARYEGLGQDSRGIWTAPSGARIAWFQDPDGNTLSLTQFPAP